MSSGLKIAKAKTFKPLAHLTEALCLQNNRSVDKYNEVAHHYHPPADLTVTLLN